MRSWRIPLLLVFALAATLVVEFWVLQAWRQGHIEAVHAPIDDAVLEPEPLPSDTSVPLIAALAPGDWSELAERPLFSPARRPNEPDVADGSAAEPEPEPETAAEPIRATLRSVVIGPDGAQAWLQPQGEERLVKIGLGDRYNDWVLETIDPNGVTLMASGRSQVLPLRPERSRQLGVDRVAPQSLPPPLQ